MLIRLFYRLILVLISPVLLYGLYRRRPNKPAFGHRWKEHFGITPPLQCREVAPIWIHAVSVGESIAAIPLIKILKEQQPNVPIVVTTTTSTGAEQIAKLGSLVEHRYMPVDFSFAVRSFINVIRPSHLLIIETELWPNTLIEAHKAGIPISVVNARLSEKSCRNYAKLQALFNTIHPCLTQILCQSLSDADRFASLGIDVNKLHVTGSIKFDISISKRIIELGIALRKEIGISRPVWIAASTHQGEDELVLQAHKELLKTHQDALLILVPRHPERFDSVFQLTQTLGFMTERRTSSKSLTKMSQVYLADTMGEMLVLLGAADVCFMGGSLLGNKVGGHNVLEPAALGIPTITGPSYFNFNEITNELLLAHGIWVKHASELGVALSDLFGHPEVRQKLASGAMNVVTHNQGALQRTINYILD
ncbi:lipid IV(A) 3-deoxy-D-manno-octulosonic acid transferase [Photobacterium damselae]|uniref:lipid IV(A) 3-deoxy-D-manno-octulosonic acid transferase n=1 Tax=Photobacterium damselae TaxID=38293 RepID=UPI0012AD5BFE|nr:lipid IV(A) 3-deoxy-D-manno-octulosonic acid transferase [Photobacterium damselae]MCG9705275.1 lipid IV(A) 3-deoxy-D-manno-octulosonic acid transferase [Photobacterium damselae]